MKGMEAPCIFLQEVDSTNSELKRRLLLHSDLPSWTLLWAHTQRSGRGQRGNSWESKPGENLTLSLLVRPLFPPGGHPFDLSVVTSLALRHLLEALGVEGVRIKWPNDIYIEEKKVAGILIENEWREGRLEASIVGVGLNVRQRVFESDAPNPTSLACHLSSVPSPSELIPLFLSEMREGVEQLRHSPSPLRRAYEGSLWRCDGEYHLFRTPSGEELEAQILGVDADGGLRLLVRGAATPRVYYFKEIAFVL